jgi:hypothetical protein
MDNSTAALSRRLTSAFPISLASSLALEALVDGPLPTHDPDRVAPPRVELASYEVLYVNLLTLYRNILSALVKGDEPSVSPGDVLETLIFEVDLIKSVVAEATHHKTKVHFYASNYKLMALRYPHAKLRVDSTPKQVDYTKTMQEVVKAYFKTHALGGTLHLFDLLIKTTDKRKGLVLTHYAHDLLSWPSFSQLDLIESHTGALKPRAAWFTKLTGGKDLYRIPFNALALQVWGDSNSFFALQLPVRQQLLALADEYKWTSATTTVDRQRYCIDTMQDKFTANILRTMLAQK